MVIQNDKVIPQWQIWFGTLICVIGAIFYCYEFVLRIVPGVLQTELCTAFGGISATTFGQLSAMYYFAYSPMQVPVGILMDRFGPRKLLIFATICCAGGSYLFSYSDSLFIAGLGRFIIGFGSSFGFVGVLSLVVNWLPKRYFSLAAGLITTLGMLGNVYGEVKLTQMVASLGLQQVLSSLVVFGITLTVLVTLIIRDRPAGMQVIHHPLNDFFKDVWYVLISKQVWVIGFVGACLYMSLSVFGELWGKSYLEYAHHLTKMEAAKGISALFIGWAIGAPLAGYLSDLFQRRVMPIIFGAICSCICISIILFVPNLSYWSLCFWLFLYGLFSGTEIVVFVMAKENSGAKLSGTVFAVTNMIITLGGVIFQPLVGKLLDVFGKNIVAEGEYFYRAVDYQFALSILPLSLIVVMIIGFFLKDAVTLHNE